MKTLYCILFSSFLLLTAHETFAQLPQLIGTTSKGGANDLGIIYKTNLDGAGFTPVYSFESLTGYNTTAGKLVLAGNNLLYGLNTNGGSNGDGCLFSFDPINNIYKDIFNFNGTNGEQPVGGLLLASNGLLYGTTFYGGSSGSGVLFAYNPAINKYAVKFNFNIEDGEFSRCTLIQASDGNLYGATIQGGLFNDGVIFTYNMSGNTYTKVYDFNESVDASFLNPTGGLIQASDGLIYGLTGFNTGQKIAVYNFNPVTRILSVSHHFRDSSFLNENVYDQPKLVPDLLGTKLYGVSPGCCSPQQNQNIFYISTKDQSYHEVFSFANIDGDAPKGGLLNYNPNHFYGITAKGGLNNSGVLFEYTASQFGGFKKLHDFTGGSGGSQPKSNLTYISCTAKPARPGAITGSITATCNKTKKYSINQISGATSYKWTVPIGATIQGASNDTVITVKWGTHSGNVSVQASNDCGISSKKSLAITVTCSTKESEATTAEFVSAASIFPNPTNGNISIKFYSANASKYSIHILDMTGRNILTHEANATKGENTMQLNLGKPAKGIYRVELTGNNNKEVFKIEVQ